MIGSNISNYKILEKIGESGKGVAHKVEDVLKRLAGLQISETASREKDSSS